MASTKVQKIYKIGILGSKPCGIGGHDCNNEIRAKIKEKIESILIDLKSQYPILLGLTSLSLGVEQDFARICLDNNISYNVILPYPNQNDFWHKLPLHVMDTYNDFFSKALNIKTLSDGSYSPKKHINRKKYIISESDMIIYVPNKLFKYQVDHIMAILKDSNKKFVTINVE
jgi:uncharacterized phage-like protein YoqJ